VTGGSYFHRFYFFVLLYCRGALRARPGIKAYLSDITYIVRPKYWYIRGLYIKGQHLVKAQGKKLGRPLGAKDKKKRKRR